MPLEIPDICYPNMHSAGVRIPACESRTVMVDGAMHAQYRCYESNCQTVSPWGDWTVPVLVPEPGIVGLLVGAVLLAGLRRGLTR